MKIGLSQKISHEEGRTYDQTDHGWYKLLVGHNLFFLPNTLNQDFDMIANTIDSFILVGGKDMLSKNPVEMTLLSKMTERGKPVIGICEGAVMIAELLGSNIQPIPNHSKIDHYVIYHGEAIKVNSDHKTGITKLHENGEILCLSDTGEVEAFIDKNLAGLMWNPERMQKPWIPPEIAFLLKI